MQKLMNTKLCEIRLGKLDEACGHFKKAETLGDKEAVVQSKNTVYLNKRFIHFILLFV